MWPLTFALTLIRNCTSCSWPRRLSRLWRVFCTQIRVSREWMELQRPLTLTRCLKQWSLTWPWHCIKKTILAAFIFLVLRLYGEHQPHIWPDLNRTCSALSVPDVIGCLDTDLQSDLGCDLDHHFLFEVFYRWLEHGKHLRFDDDFDTAPNWVISKGNLLTLCIEL